MSCCNPTNPTNCNPCCQPVPVCDATNEALASQLNNLITFLFGVIIKSCNENDEVVWSLPCDLQGAEPIPGYPNTSTSFLCYLISVLIAISESSGGDPCAGSSFIELEMNEGGQVNVDWSLGCYFRFDGTEVPIETSVTFEHLNLPTSPMSKTISLLLTGGDYEIIWISTKWSGGTAMVDKSSGDDVITFISYGDSAPYASAVQDMDTP